MKTLAYWFRQLLPSPGSLALVIVAAGLGLAAVLVAFAYGQSAPAHFLPNFGFVMGVLYAPLATILLAVAAMRESPGLSRAGLWLVAAVVLAAGGVVAAPGLIMEADMTAAVGAVAVGLFCLPPAVLMLALGVAAGVRSWPEARLLRQQWRETTALRWIEERGETDIAAVASAVDLSLDETAALLQSLAATGQFDGVIDVPTQHVYSAETLAAKKQDMLGIVAARGEVTLAGLSAELATPPGLLKGWIYEAVHNGQFTGYLNWDEDKLYSAEAEKLRSSGRCPRCGGDLALAGKGVVQCNHCGSEIFL